MKGYRKLVNLNGEQEPNQGIYNSFFWTNGDWKSIQTTGTQSIVVSDKSAFKDYFVYPEPYFS